MAKTRQNEEPKICEFELYNQEAHALEVCGEPATHKSIKRKKNLCTEHAEYARQFLGKYDIVKLEEKNG